MISTEMDVVDSASSSARDSDNTDMPLLDPKIDRGLFTAIALDLVLDGLSIVE
jgi:hypothetical protein